MGRGLVACVVAVNEPDLIVDCLRSVLAYVEHVVVIDALFHGNPATHSGMEQESVVRALVPSAALTYVRLGGRVSEAEARQAYVDVLDAGDWGLIIDSDEVLLADHGRMVHFLVEGLHGAAYAMPVYTQQVMFKGQAPEMTPEHYASGPVIWSGGQQVRLFRKQSDLLYVNPPGGTTPGLYSTHWITGHLGEGIILNRHVSQPWRRYLDDYQWEHVD